MSQGPTQTHHFNLPLPYRAHTLLKQRHRRPYEVMMICSHTNNTTYYNTTFYTLITRGSAQRGMEREGRSRGKRTGRRAGTDLRAFLCCSLSPHVVYFIIITYYILSSLTQHTHHTLFDKYFFFYCSSIHYYYCLTCEDFE